MIFQCNSVYTLYIHWVALSGKLILSLVIFFVHLTKLVQLVEFLNAV